MEADGLLARCFSHEVDHLNGVLFIDRLTPLKRNLIRTRIKKLSRTGEW
jgi:peptide deformylase